MKRIALCLLGLVLTFTAVIASAQVTTTFKLGFRALADQIPGIVGTPLENERHNAENGDGLQQTTTGLMVWRKADNWTAFTDGATTWINGPLGLQMRPNDQRFDWEAGFVDPVPTEAAAPTATPMPLPTATPMPLPTATPMPLPTATPRPLPTATPATVYSYPSDYVYRSRIVGQYIGWGEDRVIRLTNGDVWYRTTDSYRHSYSYMPAVEIFMVVGGKYQMHVEGVADYVYVRQLR